MRSESRYYQGKFYPKNPQKYKGDVKGIVYRSGWELKFMKWCDLNEMTLEWSSEEFVIPYYYPLDGRMHRYFPDFWVKQKCNDGTIKEYLIEIKPQSEIAEPKKQARVTPAYIKRVNTFVKNTAKWKAAEMFCEQKRKQGSTIEFIKLNEHDLHIS